MNSLSETDSLKVGAIFVIAVAALGGFWMPLMFVEASKRRHKRGQKRTNLLEHPIFMAAKAFSAGIILGVAIMHLLPDGMEDLEQVADYPLALAMMCAGVILTLCMEQALSLYSSDGHHHHHGGSEHQHNHSLAARLSQDIQESSLHGPGGDISKILRLKEQADDMIVHDHVHNHNLSSEMCDESCSMQNCQDHVIYEGDEENGDDNMDHDHDHDHGHEHSHHSSHSGGCCDSNKEKLADHLNHAGDHDHSHSHIPSPTHSWNSANSVGLTISNVKSTDNGTSMKYSQLKPAYSKDLRATSHVLSVDPETLKKLQQRAFVKTMVLEVSIATHSIIVGFGFGLIVDTLTMKVLLIALSFHQFFEGVSLGTTIAETALDSRTKTLFSLVFGFTMPIGIAIGLLTTSQSSTGSSVQGYANSLASGSLLYSSLVEMVAELFNSDSLRHAPLTRVAMVLSFAFGCGILAMLAVWA
jgi:zinc transporter ZupT